MLDHSALFGTVNRKEFGAQGIPQTQSTLRIFEFRVFPLLDWLPTHMNPKRNLDVVKNEMNSKRKINVAKKDINLFQI